MHSWSVTTREGIITATYLLAYQKARFESKFLNIFGDIAQTHVREGFTPSRTYPQLGLWLCVWRKHPSAGTHNIMPLRNYGAHLCPS